MKRLILAPHADDESLGCGGLLAKYPSECRVIVLTQSEPERTKEFKAAMRVLKVHDFHFVNFEDGHLSMHVKQLVSLLDYEMSRYRPDEVYLPFPSLHQDHITVYEAGMRASRLSMHHQHWFPPQVLVYDVVAYDVNLYATDLRWNVFESLDGTQVNAKQEACRQYESECGAGPTHPINSVREIAAAIGRPRNLRYAEQYALVRQVR